MPNTLRYFKHFFSRHSSKSDASPGSDLLLMFSIVSLCLGMLAGMSMLQVAYGAPLSAAQAHLVAARDLQLAEQTDPPDQQAQQLSGAQVLIQANLIAEGNAVLQDIDCLLYTSDAADD